MFFLTLITLVFACNAHVNETGGSIISPPVSNRRAQQRMHYAMGPGWKRYDPLSDEFNWFNTRKWRPSAPGWKGRQPGRFTASLVKVQGGHLKLYSDHGWISSADRRQGYKNWRTAYVTSTGLFPKVAFAEIRARSGSSKISSSWWFSRTEYTNRGKWRTEIDVIESSGRKNQRQDLYGNMYSHLHTWNLPGYSGPWAVQGKCGCKVKKGTSSCAIPHWHGIGKKSFSDDFHIFGLMRTIRDLKFYLDGHLVWSVPNRCFFQNMNMIFDRETMFDWLGAPAWKDVPDSPYEIDYVRTWTP